MEPQLVSREQQPGGGELRSFRDVFDAEAVCRAQTTTQETQVKRAWRKEGASIGGGHQADGERALQWATEYLINRTQKPLAT